MNILAVTMGTTWQVIPELAGFLNPSLGIYENHCEKEQIDRFREKYNLKPVDEIWVITTSGDRTDCSVKQLKDWDNVNKMIKYFRIDKVEELATVDECKLMADYIYRVVLHAKNKADNLYLSLAGGRKTMSAEMQRAGSIFGCDAMLHVVDKNMNEYKDEFSSLDFLSPIPKHLTNFIMPLVTIGKTYKDPVLSIGGELIPKDYPLDQVNDNCLYREINKRINEAKNHHLNYTKKIIEGKISSNFRSLYSCSSETIARLDRTTPDYDMIKRLPKAELHCHFGGIANPSQMIEIALANEVDVNKVCLEREDVCSWLGKIKKLVDSEDIQAIWQEVPDVKELRSEKFKNVKEPFTVAGFLMQFAEKPQLLREFIYGRLDGFKGVGIDLYEPLGDLQGSGLLQSENSLRKACQVLVRMCREHNVKYIEVRCSPVNYTRGGLAARRVVEVMMEEFDQAKYIHFMLIFIASRHGKMSDVYRHVELAEEMLNEREISNFKKYFAGFDLAGAEGKKTPAQLREAFLPLMEKCVHLTIHAGETKDVNSIWQAVYHLNADRIGHGLALKDDEELMQKMKNRKLTVEMCPSSNDQIVGFDGDYSAKEYLAAGIKVTVNTDNPGISETDFSKEYLVANELCKEKLSLWDVLAMIRNSFRGGFVDMDTKRKLILDAEKEIIELLTKSSL